MLSLQVPLWGLISMYYICHLMRPLSDSVITLHMNKPRLRGDGGLTMGTKLGRDLKFQGSWPPAPALHATLQKAVEAGFIEGGCVTSSAAL